MKKANATTVTVPLKLPGDLSRQIKAAAQKNGLSEADVMRLSIRRGIGILERALTISRRAA